MLKYAIKENKPMVIYIPLGCNFTNHRGDTILENYIDDISINRGIVVVTACGNEGDAQIHTSGNIKKSGEVKELSIYVDPVQTFLATQIWIRKPNIMSINIISPSGEETGIVPSHFNSSRKMNYIFENTQVRIISTIPEESSGDQLIEIYWYNIKAGIWKLRLSGDYILDGRFDAWLPQRGLVFGETKYLNSDCYGTLMSPGSALATINVACYDQTKNYIVNESARAFEEELNDRVDIAAGGINVRTANLEGDGYSVVSGTSASAAVVAGACLLLLQWGIVNGNSDDMYSQKIKTFLIGGTSRRTGDIYPNPELGFGILDLVGVFKYMT